VRCETQNCTLFLYPHFCPAVILIEGFTVSGGTAGNPSTVAEWLFRTDASHLVGPTMGRIRPTGSPLTEKIVSFAAPRPNTA
jgi:hypothetical protein